MKKIIMFLMAATLIFGFAGVAMAEDACSTCAEPGTINRVCPEEQKDCTLSTPFDYEDQLVPFIMEDQTTAYYDLNNYCDDPKTPRRVLFPACNCENFKEDDTIDIRMEILVNGLTGDNGAYWAQDVNTTGIQVGTYTSIAEGCTQKEEGRYYDGEGDPGVFTGVYEYWYYDDDGILQNDGEIYNNGGVNSFCWDDIEDNDAYRVVVIQPDPDCEVNTPGSHGFTITEADDAENRAYWAINIPWIRFDTKMIKEGDQISVRICVAKAKVDPDGDNDGCVDLGGICGDTGCCCEFVLGTMGCCLEPDKTELIYPYATPMNSADWWYGMVITNVSDKAGVAEITVYETDGDTATTTVTVEANNMFVTNNQGLMAIFGGTIGDSKAYFEVNTEFDASGFMYIGNDVKGEAMGYLAE